MAMLGNQTREGTMQTYSHVATAGQTSFPCSYGVGSSSVSVFQNGVLLTGSDINLTSGNAAVLNVAAAVNDEITIQVQDVFSVADTVSATTGGTFAGNVTHSGNVTFSGTTSGIDMNGTELVLDADGDTGITADTDDRIDFKIAGSDRGNLHYDSNDFFSLESNDYLTLVQNQTAEKGLIFGPTYFKPYNAHDNTLDLGIGAARFKDLYLGGGIYLGGTGAANKIEDFETGTWTATLYNPPSGITNAASTSSLNRYTKIGNIVFIQGVLSITNDNSSANISLSGLPFTAASASAAGGGQISRYGSTNNFNPYVGGNSSLVEFYHSNNSGNWNAAQYSEVGDWYVHFNVYYSTDA